jgi:S-adenosylmethionine:tRNA ribosyltransferase-isomerase
MYKVSDFDFHLPEELIAQYPAVPRDTSRLLVYNRNDGSITDDFFFNIGNHLPSNSTLVVNNSKVEKARIQIENFEIFVLRQLDTHRIEALVRPGKKFKVGKKVQLTTELMVSVDAVMEDGVRILSLHPDLNDDAWTPHRLTPFPPYMKQDESLANNYQTVYAKDEGSKAAPTAGLHFTDSLINQLLEKGHPLAELTLHVGLGTFAPVKAELIQDHKMHSEWYSIDARTAETLNNAQHITAVGTTSARTLESIVEEVISTKSNRLNSKSEIVNNTGTFEIGKDNMLNGIQEIEVNTGYGARRSFTAGSGSTDIFITPGYKFKAVDSLITNFHLPKSTLLMLVSTLTGFDEMHKIYRHAIQNKYRFYSFGDAMLII